MRRGHGSPRFALEIAAGLAGSLALVSLLTLVLAGSLPHLSLFAPYVRLYGSSGYAMLPVHPLVGVSTILFVTYVAAIGTATVRAVSRNPDRLLTGMLTWSGVFGLGTGAYYVGRSHPEVLTNLFPTWALCVTLLAVAALRAIAARAPRAPSPAQVACLVGLGVLVCSLAQTPTPWSQIARLRKHSAPTLANPAGEAFVAAHTESGEPVALLTTLGHRLAAKIGVVNVTPYPGQDSMPTVEQLNKTLAVLRQEGGRKVFLSQTQSYWGAFPTVVERSGFRLVAVEEGSDGMVLFERD